MKILWFIIASVHFAFSQGMYLDNENGFTANIDYGRFNSDSKLGFSTSYSIKGYIDLFFTRSSIIDEKRTSNYQDEYFTCFYILKNHRLFYSGGIGYVYQYSKTDLWENFPLIHTIKGASFQGGLHLILEDQKPKKIVTSLFYRYSEPIEEYKIPTGIEKHILITRSFIFEGVLIYEVSKINFILGPKLVMDYDVGNTFFGFKFSTMLNH